MIAATSDGVNGQVCRVVVDYDRPMGEVVTMAQVRTTISIDGEWFLLAPGQEVSDLKRRVEAAVEPPGHFVDFTVVGGRDVSALITPGTRVVISSGVVLFDPRDAGEPDFMHLEDFDL